MTRERALFSSSGEFDKATSGVLGLKPYTSSTKQTKQTNKHMHTHFSKGREVGDKKDGGFFFFRRRVVTMYVVVTLPFSRVNTVGGESIYTFPCIRVRGVG